MDRNWRRKGLGIAGSAPLFQVTLAEDAEERIARGHSLNEGHREMIPIRDYMVERVKLFLPHIAGGRLY